MAGSAEKHFQLMTLFLIELVIPTLSKFLLVALLDILNIVYCNFNLLDADCMFPVDRLNPYCWEIGSQC